MALTKEQKQKIVNELKEKLDQQKAMVFADFSGLKVKDMSELRRKMKEAGCEFKVAKKTLLSLAMKGRGMDIDFKKMKGEIALGFGYQDQIMPFKVLYGFSKGSEGLKILGGVIDNEILEKEKAIEIAQLPAREELLAKLMRSISAPISGLVNVLQGNLRGLVFLLSARCKTGIQNAK